MARFRAPSDDSDDEPMSPDRPQRAQRESLPTETSDSEYEPSYDSEEEGSDIYSEIEDSTEEEDITSLIDEKSTILPWAREVGVAPQRMHVMQSTLFRQPEEEAALREVTQPSPSRPVLEPTLGRKHSRDSEGDGLRAESQPRISFADDVEAQPFRPTRKYARVDISASAVKGNESTIVDAGLAIGRSFRVGWGPGGTLVHLGSLCSPLNTPKYSSNSSLVHISTLPAVSTSEKEARQKSLKLLQHHFSHTSIEYDADGIPFANPSNDLTFSSFVSLFPSNDRSFEANLFRLGQALFDHLELGVPNTLPEDIRAKVAIMRRRRAFSEWLQSAVASDVESDIRRSAANDWASEVFALLTGNQLEKAADVAIDAGNVKLATLLSQAPGDEEFREDLRSQLAIWRQQHVDAHMNENVRKIYALLAGIVDVLEGSKGTEHDSAPNVAMAAGLDWKRAFGLHLWFKERMDTPIFDAFQSYVRASGDPNLTTSRPTPWYREGETDGSQFLWRLPHDSSPPDALFSLIKLFSEPSTTLSDILSPLSFSPSPMDHRLPWHLYIILSRCLRIRDLADRAEPVEDGDDAEGHSPSADLLANSYASQLEKLGLIQDAAFILLHLEGSAGRKRAIKDLLARSASKLDDFATSGLVGSMKIPLTWVNEAKADYALSRGNIFEAYELYLNAGMYNAAHNLAVLELAPDAVIREDLELLKELFERFIGKSVDGWTLRGKLFLDYVNAMTRLPLLRKSVAEAEMLPDRSEGLELEELSRSVPKLINLLPDVWPDHNNLRYKAALSEMITGLTDQLGRARPLAIHTQLKAPLATESTRLRLINATSLERFRRTIEVA